jgi:hypothetical protein
MQIERLSPDLAADAIFFAIEARHLRFGDVSAMLAGVIAFLAADAAIFHVKVPGLGFGQFALFALLGNPAILVVQARIDFDAAGMLGLPSGGIGGRGGSERGKGEGKSDNE